MQHDAKQQLLAAANLDELYPVIAANLMTAGWHKKRRSLYPEPQGDYRPLHWRWEHGRIALDQAGRWIGTELAERRNLLLYNPGGATGDNDYDTVRTLVVAYQMIKPGEYARSHQHTPNAMRLILDADEGCFTVVNGVKLPMRTGDFLITPGGCWHSHYNEGTKNAYWIDVLDVPLVHRLGPMIFGEDPAWNQKEESSPAEHPFYFPPSRTQPALAALPATNGVKRLTLDTQTAMKPLDIGMFHIAAGAAYSARKSTASSVFCVISGSGQAKIGSMSTEWSVGDVLAAPAWNPIELKAGADAVLLEVSDAPVMHMLGFYRQG